MYRDIIVSFKIKDTEPYQIQYEQLYKLHYTHMYCNISNVTLCGNISPMLHYSVTMICYMM